MARAARNPAASTSNSRSLTTTGPPAPAFSSESSLSGRKRLSRRSHSANSRWTSSPACPAAASSVITETSVPMAGNATRLIPAGMVSFPGQEAPDCPSGGDCEPLLLNP